MAKKRTRSILLFPDGSGDIVRWKCSYNAHILKFYLWRMFSARKMNSRIIYEHYVKQINLEFQDIHISLPYETKTIQVERSIMVPSATW